MNIKNNRLNFKTINRSSILNHKWSQKWGLGIWKVEIDVENANDI